MAPSKQQRLAWEGESYPVAALLRARDVNAPAPDSVDSVELPFRQIATTKE